MRLSLHQTILLATCLAICATPARASEAHYRHDGLNYIVAVAARPVQIKEGIGTPWGERDAAIEISEHGSHGSVVGRYRLTFVTRLSARVRTIALQAKVRGSNQSTDSTAIYNGPAVVVTGAPSRARFAIPFAGTVTVVVAITVRAYRATARVESVRFRD